MSSLPNLISYGYPRDGEDLRRLLVERDKFKRSLVEKVSKCAYSVTVYGPWK